MIRAVDALRHALLSATGVVQETGYCFVILGWGRTDAIPALTARLGERFKTKAQTRPAIAEAKFEIVLGICDASGRLEGKPVPGADKLAGLHNSDQAYVIAPDGPACEPRRDS